VITVLLVEDHASYGQALETVMALEGDIQMVAILTHGGAAGEAAADHRPDVAIVDLDLPGPSGIDVILDIRASSPATSCLVLTGLTDDVELGRTIEAGAAAILHKSVDIADLLDTVRAVAAGATALPVEDTARRLRALAVARERGWHAQLMRERLSPREVEVLAQLAQGSSSRQVARSLEISPETVQTHIRNILAKLGVGSRLEAVATALRLRLVPPPS
jgi:DNA-binding NarL/FixJ family response regulator